MNQDYPGAFEVLMVNDGSTDDYEKVLAPYCASTARPIKIIPSHYDKAVGLTSKQQAI